MSSWGRKHTGKRELSVVLACDDGYTRGMEKCPKTPRVVDSDDDEGGERLIKKVGGCGSGGCGCGGSWSDMRRPLTELAEAADELETLVRRSSTSFDEEVSKIVRESSNQLHDLGESLEEAAKGLKRGIVEAREAMRASKSTANTGSAAGGEIRISLNPAALIKRHHWKEQTAGVAGMARRKSTDYRRDDFEKGRTRGRRHGLVAPQSPDKILQHNGAIGRSTNDGADAVDEKLHRHESGSRERSRHRAKSKERSRREA